MKRFITLGVAALLAISVAGPASAKDVKIGLSWDARESALNQAWEDFMKAEAKTQGEPLGINVEWIQYRVVYRLQVSPAPATV